MIIFLFIALVISIGIAIYITIHYNIINDILNSYMETSAALYLMHCLNKNKYFSEEEANDTARYECEVRNIKLRSYHCHQCGWWHLTKNLDPMPYIKGNKYISKRNK